jgi:epoxyqueuosine reductase
VTETRARRLEDRLQEAALEIGFGAFGIAPAEPLAGERTRLLDWLAADRHGSMEYLARDPEMRLDPNALLEGVRSVICVAHVYEPREDPGDEPAPSPGGSRGGPPFIARYARGRDYHRVLRGKLRRLLRTLDAELPECRSRMCVDTAPLLEKAWAERAGIGWRGKHTNLVSRTLGSWTVLGEILTTAELEPSAPHLDHCGSCRRCLDACPTQAFPEPYVMDATRCISYLTIEHRGPLDDASSGAIGDRLFGCDDCLVACPWNRFHAPTDDPDFAPREAIVGVDLTGWIEMSEEELDARLRGSAVRRARLAGIRRNARAVARNRDRSDG